MYRLDCEVFPSGPCFVKSVVLSSHFYIRVQCVLFLFSWLVLFPCFIFAFFSSLSRTCAYSLGLLLSDNYHFHFLFHLLVVCLDSQRTILFLTICRLQKVDLHDTRHTMHSVKVRHNIFPLMQSIVQLLSVEPYPLLV